MGTPKGEGYLNSREVPSEVKEGWIETASPVPPWRSLCLFVVPGEALFLPETTGCLWETNVQPSRLLRVGRVFALSGM